MISHHMPVWFIIFFNFRKVSGLSYKPLFFKIIAIIEISAYINTI